MSYVHLTQDERYQIQELRIEKKTITAIAVAMNRSSSTIRRELKRNRGAYRWSPVQAQKNYQMRRKNCCNARRIKETDWQAVADYILLDLSPQQAISRLSLERGCVIAISHETIYQRIYAERRKGKDALFKRLRSQKPYRKRYGSGLERRGRIKNRISIDLRPAIVDQKSRLGDWEGDTVIGKAQQGVLLTLVERHSRYAVAERLPSKHANRVAFTINRLLWPHREKCHTITFDNGLEFARHALVSACLKADVYFAHPYCSWERGANENMNGLIRQYFPKKSSLKAISQRAVQLAIHKLNHRPRKCLGYKTPYEVFFNKDILPLISPPRCTS